jgi:opacity protein-like surface antigen
MRKTVKINLTVACLALIAGSANAATQGGYAGAGLGYSRLQTPDTFLQTNNAVQVVDQIRQRGGLGGRVFGGYNLNEYVGVEAGFSQYVKSKYNSQLESSGFNFAGYNEYTMSAVDLVGKAYLPLGNTGLNAYALGGAALVHSKARANVSWEGIILNSASSRQNKLRPKFGLGASYAIPATKLTTSVEWSRIQGKGNLKNDIRAIPNADMATLNISYNFG